MTTEPIRPRRVVRRKGTRGALADLQLVCGAGPYELDVLVREYPAHLEVVGQVTWSGRVFDPVPALPLDLVNVQTAILVERTRTDDFGEFNLKSAAAAPCGIRLGAEPEAPCVLVWEGVAA